MRNEDLVAAVLAKIGSGEAKPPAEADAKLSCASKTTKSVPKTKPNEFDYPVEPLVIQVVKKPKTYQNHSYRDFSIVPAENYGRPTQIEDMSFSEKLHDILSSAEHINTQAIIWMPHGRAFRILIPQYLEKQRILQKYFGHNRFSSFLRQLSNHGYKHITQGPDRNCYYHECFLRGLPHLSKYAPDHKDARRLIPDPENEPDLYKVSKTYPLPDSKDHEEAEVPVQKQSHMISAVATAPRASGHQGLPVLGAPTQHHAPVSGWRWDQAPLAKFPRLQTDTMGMASSMPGGWPYATVDVTHVRNALQLEEANQRQATIVKLDLMVKAELEMLAAQRQRTANSQAGAFSAHRHL